MSDADRLAALLKELDPLAVSMDDLAARLVAAGVRVGDPASASAKLEAIEARYEAEVEASNARIAALLRGKARAALLAELEAGVEGRRLTRDIMIANGVEDPEAENAVWQFNAGIAAVLDLIRRAGEK